MYTTRLVYNLPSAIIFLNNGIFCKRTNYKCTELGVVLRKTILIKIEEVNVLLRMHRA